MALWSDKRLFLVAKRGACLLDERREFVWVKRCRAFWGYRTLLWWIHSSFLGLFYGAQRGSCLFEERREFVRANLCQWKGVGLFSIYIYIESFCGKYMAAPWLFSAMYGSLISAQRGACLFDERREFIWVKVEDAFFQVLVLGARAAAQHGADEWHLCIALGWRRETDLVVLL